MNISILGCGRWASFHAWYAHHIGHNVTVWGRKNSANLQTLMATHKNEYLTLPEDIHFTDDLATALHFADTVIISISSQQLRDLAQQINKTGIYQNKTFVLCMKGIEISTGKRLSEVLAEELTGSFDIGVWVGPGHVQDFLQGIPNCMVVQSSAASSARK